MYVNIKFIYFNLIGHRGLSNYQKVSVVVFFK